MVQHEDGVHTPDFMVPFMEEAFEGMTLTPPPPLPHRSPSDPHWLQHSYSVDQAFATRIRGLDALLLERSQLPQSLAGMVPVPCGAAPEFGPFVVCQMWEDLCGP